MSVCRSTRPKSHVGCRTMEDAGRRRSGAQRRCRALAAGTAAVAGGSTALFCGSAISQGSSWNRPARFFVSHDAPTFALDPGLAGPLLARLGQSLPLPRAVPAVSAALDKARRCVRDRIRLVAVAVGPGVPSNCPDIVSTLDAGNLRAFDAKADHQSLLAKDEGIGGVL